MEADVTVDARGLFCPMPILKLAQAVQAAERGAVVLLLATDPGVEPDVAAWCEATGHQLLDVGRSDDGYRARVRRKG